MEFQSVYIEITNQCGLSCSFCPSFSKLEQNMDFKDFKNVLTQLQGKTRVISLHVWGDPLTSQKIVSYLDLAKEYNFKVRLVTSGFHLAKHNPSLLSHEALLQCAISLNSAAQLSASRRDYYFDTLFDWLNYHEREGLFSFLNLRLWRKDSKDDKFIFETIKRLNNHFQVEIPYKLNPNSFYQLGAKIRLVNTRYFQWPQHSNTLVKPSRCHGLVSQVAILSDMRVVPCCMDGRGEVELGNLFNNTLDEILASSKAISIKDGFKHKRVMESFCNYCGYRERFLS